MKEFRKRLFPTLLLDRKTFMKSKNFKGRRYVGNPLNTIQIFNQIGVDEIAILDVNAFQDGINYRYLSQIAAEAFVPLAYGGGIKCLEDAERIISLGFEKIILCSSFLDENTISRDISNALGASSVTLCLNVKKRWLAEGYSIYDHRVGKSTAKFNINLVQKIENLGYGEIIVQSVDADGTWAGYPTELLDLINMCNFNIPVDCLGGINSIGEIRKLMDMDTVSAVSISSLALFQRKDQGVVISFPSDEELMVP